MRAGSGFTFAGGVAVAGAVNVITNRIEASIVDSLASGGRAAAIVAGDGGVTVEADDVDLDTDGETMLAGMTVEVVDPVTDYAELMRKLFDFDAIRAADAKAMGMIWDVVPDAELAACANSLAERLATQPTRAFALAKQALNASSTHTLAEQLELEATLQHEAGLTADFHEGVRAFMEKRPPRWTGS